jgi:DNA-directed RNA polymerase subunit RPC12/RpoP
MPKLISQLEMAQCPHCGVNTPNLYLTHSFDTTASVGSRKRFWKIYVCKRCGGVVSASSNTSNGDVSEIYPSETEIDQSIPDPAKTYLAQAAGSIHAPAGAIMLAASSVDAMLKAYNYKDGSLYSRIDLAAKNHLITDGMAKWAHEVRLDANDQRHADESASLPDETDARRSVEFAMALAQFLFSLPARVKRGLAKASGKDTSAA